jgi:hypothetical protein
MAGQTISVVLRHGVPFHRLPASESRRRGAADAGWRDENRTGLERKRVHQFLEEEASANDWGKVVFRLEQVHEPRSPVSAHAVLPCEQRHSTGASALVMPGVIYDWDTSSSRAPPKNRSHPLRYIQKSFASTLVSIRIHFVKNLRIDCSHSHLLLKLTVSAGMIEWKPRPICGSSVCRRFRLLIWSARNCSNAV